MKKTFLIAAAGLALTACNNDDNYMDQPTSAHVTATIGESNDTRASDTSWNGGDNIGITMGTRYINLKYTTESGNGIFSGTPMYFSDKRVPVDLTAYYPFAGNEGTIPGENASGIIKANTDAENQTPDRQPEIDFLFASEKNIRGDIDPTVKFTFSHRMSRLTFTFNNDTGASGIKVAKYEIDGLIMNGTFDTASGICDADDEAPRTLSVTELPDETDGVTLQSLILFPQSVENRSVMLKITDNEGQYYTCELKFKDNELLAGNHYRHTITIRKTGLMLNEASITDWWSVDGSSNASSSDYPE